MIIYETINKVNGKLYRGQHTCTRECGGLKGNCRYLGSGESFIYALKKYGKENFTRITLATANSFEELNDLEECFVTEEFVERADTYNLKTGGGGRGIIGESARASQRAAWVRRRERGWKTTPETRKKMSESHKGKKLSAEHRRQIGLSNKGKIVSNETKKKMSLATKGRKVYRHTDETKKKISLSTKGRKGKKHSPETKRKLSDASKGNQSALGHKHTDETKKKISRANKGRKITEETKKKMRESRPVGSFKHTDETKQKIRENSIKQWATPATRHRLECSIEKRKVKHAEETGLPDVKGI